MNYIFSKLKLFVLSLVILFSCKEEVVEIKKPEITIISPNMGPYKSEEQIDIMIVISSNTGLKSYNYEIINNLWPGYYSKFSGTLTGKIDTVRATFSYSTTTEKHFGLHVNAWDINGEKAETATSGFTVKNR